MTSTRLQQDTADSSPAAPFYIVLNSGSGHGDPETTHRTIAEVLEAAGRPHEIFQVDDSSQLQLVARRAVTKAQQNRGIVVAVGGDGTLNAVAQATLGSGCRFGVIPQGTFNYFGRTHGVSCETAVAARALLTAEVCPVPVGLVNDKVFLVNASLGLYPQALEDREAQKKRLGRSRLVAAWAALLTIFGNLRPLRIRLEQVGRAVELRTLTLFVSTNRLQLEQMGLDASALKDDQFMAIVLKPVSTLRLLWLALQGAMGRLSEADAVETFALTNLQITPSNRAHRLKIATDGEVAWINTPIFLRMAPEPLLLLTPRDATPEVGSK